MDYKFMEHITDLQIQREINDRMARDAIRQKQIQETQEKYDAAILIVSFIVCVLIVGFLGG